eukprot:10595049-Karenia_brevis.AAC.1
MDVVEEINEPKKLADEMDENTAQIKGVQAEKETGLSQPIHAATRVDLPNVVLSLGAMSSSN